MQPRIVVHCIATHTTVRSVLTIRNIMRDLRNCPVLHTSGRTLCGTVADEAIRQNSPFLRSLFMRSMA